jgi:hypothetical protein
MTASASHRLPCKCQNMDRCGEFTVECVTISTRRLQQLIADSLVIAAWRPLRPSISRRGSRPPRRHDVRGLRRAGYDHSFSRYRLSASPSLRPSATSAPRERLRLRTRCRDPRCHTTSSGSMAWGPRRPVLGVLSNRRRGTSPAGRQGVAGSWLSSPHALPAEVLPGVIEEWCNRRFWSLRQLRLPAPKRAARYLTPVLHSVPAPSRGALALPRGRLMRVERQGRCLGGGAAAGPGRAPVHPQGRQGTKPGFACRPAGGTAYDVPNNADPRPLVCVPSHLFALV